MSNKLIYGYKGPFKISGRLVQDPLPTGVAVSREYIFDPRYFPSLAAAKAAIIRDLRKKYPQGYIEIIDKYILIDLPPKGSYTIVHEKNLYEHMRLPRKLYVSTNGRYFALCNGIFYSSNKSGELILPITKGIRLNIEGE